MKDYMKPDLEYVSLIAEEAIADSLIDGSMGVEDAPEDW